MALAVVAVAALIALRNTFGRTHRYSVTGSLEELGEVLLRTTDLMALLAEAGHTIASTLGTEYVNFVVRSEQGGAIVGGTKASHIPKSVAHRLAASPQFTGVCRTSDDPSHVELDDELCQTLQSSGVSMVVGLGEVGFMLIGKGTEQPYTARDERLVSLMRSELTIAIQNARLIHEVRSINQSLEQSIADATRKLRASNEKLKKLDATKDEFVSMASHQLRTPLTSIKGYLSMVLDGDAGEISGQQRLLLSEAFTSSERMVRLIGDFLNVSRLQTGKFIIDRRPTDIGLMVQEEVESMQTMAESHDLKLLLKKPKKLPELTIDEDKFRQVVMNFIDNAIYYSRPKSTIVVTISQPSARTVALDVQGADTEIASRQRPDGTGVGLFLAQKIVTAHGGTMIFSSTEGKGSTFGFTLPVER